MKKILFTIMALAMTAMTFQSCEDVPMPYDTPTEKPDVPVVPGEEAEGDGTLEKPFNAAGATEYTKALGSDVNSENDIYIKGVVVSVEEEYTTNFGNGSYTIASSADAKTTFKVWRAMYLGNKKYADGQAQIKVGDEVVVCGKVVYFKGNTPETVQGQAYLYSLNGKTEGGDAPAAGVAKGSGTLDDPFNSVAANDAASKLGKDEKSEQGYYIKGKVVSVKEQFGTQYGNASFYISDDGTSAGQFYCFRVLYFGNQKYTSGETLKVGDEVVVYGKLINYMGNTPETVQGDSYLYSLNGKTESTGGGETPGTGGGETPGTGGSDTPDEGSLLSNGGFETWADGIPANWVTASTAGNASLSQSTDARSGKFSVAVGNTSTANKRMAYKEIELEAGKYVFSFYAKAEKGGNCQTRPGYVPVENGKVGSYVYGEYSNLKNTEWTLVSYEFELAKKTTVCVLLMNPKASGYHDAQSILVDDAKLTKK